MAQSPIDRVLKALQHGWQPYAGRVDDQIYRDLVCPNSRRARWFERQGRYMCIGCSRSCLRDNASNAFDPMLPIKMIPDIPNVPRITARELLEKKVLLNVREVQYIMNISRAQVYERVADGRLLTGGDGRPVRILTESVRKAIAKESA